MFRWHCSRHTLLLADTYLDDYKRKKGSFLTIFNIHRKGFSVDDWLVSGVNKDNYKSYLTSVQYYSMHPLNGQFSHWIDDKLTLKYLCSGTSLDKYMPLYYYYIDDKGNQSKLMDCENRSDDYKVIDLLKDKKDLAIKRVSGAIGEGFYYATYTDETIYVNGKKMNDNDFHNFICGLRSYIITEYFKPHKELQSISSGTVNSFRYLIGRVNGKMKRIDTYIRFGTKNSKFVENYAAGGVLCFVDKDGKFTEGNLLVDGKNMKIATHPDNGTQLCGQLPLWDEVLKAIDEFDQFFPCLQYLGIDFVFTSENKVKILEINSLTSLDALQMNGSLLEGHARDFYIQYLK